MIKTKGFVSIFLFIICGFIFFITPSFADQKLDEIILTPMAQPKLNINESPKLYLPSKMVIGTDTIFKITGNPGSKVSLAISNTNNGSKPLFGNKLRLGKTEMTLEGIIPATGILELKLNAPMDKSLVDQVKYFEAATWSKEDYNDLQVATTISPSGKETFKNSVAYSEPYATGKRPSFEPVIPGMGQEFMKSLEAINKTKEGKNNSELIDEGNEPAYLDSPEKTDLILHNINKR